MDKIKKIPLKINFKSSIYKFKDELYAIEIIKPTNILIMNIKKVFKTHMKIKRNKIKYCLNEIMIVLSFDDKIKIIKDIVNSMCELHQMDIINGNLKSNNILLDEDYNVYIVDYCINQLRNDDVYTKNDDINSVGKLINDILKNEIENKPGQITLNYRKIINRYLSKNNNVSLSTVKSIILSDSILIYNRG